MIELAIDLETYSDEDIKSGVHKYVESENFEILLCAYKLGDAETRIIDLKSGEKFPQEFISAFFNKKVLKTAYNAAFEIACLSKYFLEDLDTTEWSCTMALAAQAGLPFGLDLVSTILNTTSKKDSKGKDLIKFFCVPCKPTKTNGGRTRNLPEHDLEKWSMFKQYCVTDVNTEQDIRRAVSWYEVSEFEKPMWSLDQKVNNKGVLVDMDIVKNAISINEKVTNQLIDECIMNTGIENPNSDAQIKKYIYETTGENVESLSKAVIDTVKEKFKGTEIENLLKIRDQLSRTSIKKFYAMEKSALKSNNRICGLFQYYGANRTGRWAGRNVQLQNLKRNDLKDLDLARKLVKNNDLETLKLLFDDISEVLSNLIRPSFIPSKGKKFIISDLSAIEARIVSWLSGETWRLKVFATHGKIYEASASMMFKVPLESITKESPLRMKGKISELALGYQGAVGALERMGGAAMGLSQTEMLKLVKQWRNANPKIVKYWYDVQDAAIETIVNGTSTRVGYVKFHKQGKNMLIELPSKRKLVYINARFDGDSITYDGLDQVSGKWCRQPTYGGKLVENITQAIARDVIADIMHRLDKMGYEIAMHVHDEIVVEHETDDSKIVTSVLSASISWAPGLPLAAETFVAEYYQK